MKIHTAFLFAFSLLILQSCSSGNNKPKDNPVIVKDTVPVKKENFAKGQIIEKVINLSDATQSYALYLPSNYSVNKTFPVIYIFDSHGMGKLPVSMYKNLAEKYGYILIGSNNSKNGIAWEESQTIANELFADSQQRLSINKDRITLLGFSGGARVANGLTLTNGGIAGVICCGAAAPAVDSKDARSNYTFLGIAGNKDFNYVEMRKYDMIALAGHRVKHAFIEFDGKHEWPKEEIMSDAFLWTELNAMRVKKIPINDSLVSYAAEPMLKKITELQKSGKIFEAYNQVKKEINFFDGLTSLTKCYEIYNSIKNSAEVDKKLKDEEKIWKKENELKKYYQDAFQSENNDWWKKDIASVNKKMKDGKNNDEALMYARVLDYLSLVAYMQTTGAMQQNNIQAAKMFSALYLLIDPTNSEAYYLSANISAKEGNQKETIISLNGAIKNGFIDISRLQNDSTFSAINSSEEFKSILKKVNDASIQASSAH